MNLLRSYTPLSLLSLAILQSLLFMAPASADHYLLTYNGSIYDSALDQTTFSYTAEGTGRPPALSHFVAGLPICSPPLQLISATPSTNIIQTDPTTGTYGIKWDFGLGTGDTLTYSYTLAGNIPEGDVRLSVKAGQLVEHYDLRGPACPNGEELADLGDFVWVDSNSDGIQDSSEKGIAGVGVNLMNCAGETISSTATSANGKYLFSNLAPGGYIVEFELPTGYTFSPTNNSSNDAVDSDADRATGRTSCTTLLSDTSNFTLDAGIFETKNPGAKLGDYVWIDSDIDGVQDANENGIGGVRVNLLTCSGEMLSNTMSSPDGNYLFFNLAAGSYVVEFELPTGFTFSPANNTGDDERDSDANIVNGRTPCVSVLSDTIDLSLDAGVYQTQTPGAELGDFVWIDADLDGTQDSTEAGLGGVEVNLLTCSGNKLSTTMTSAGGAYLFSGLAAGSYIVEFELPLGFSFTQANAGASDANDSDADTTSGRTDCITLSDAESNLTLDAGVLNVQRPDAASLGDLVWMDTNADGVQDDNEIGIDGVIVRLFDCSGQLIDSTQTSGGGGYFFSNLNAGNYMLAFTAPEGYEISPRNQGAFDFLDSDVDSSTGRTECISLEAGTSDRSWDMGVFQDDPICSTEKLESPVRFFWNGMLDQVNILSVRNTCDSDEAIVLKLYDIDGNLRDERSGMLFAKAQRDIIINELEGFATNSYGYLELIFSAIGCIDGHSMYYRNTVGGVTSLLGIPSLDFTVGAALENAVRGTTYAHYNTNQPSWNPEQVAWIVPNWLQVMNLDRSQPKTFTKKLYARNGELLHEESFSVPPLGRRDFEAGHVNPGPGHYGLIEIIPADPNADYLAQILRTGTNANLGELPTSYPFALMLQAKKSSANCQWGHLSRGASAQNWLAISNTSDESAEVTVRIFEYYGERNNDPIQLVLDPHQQHHIFANEFMSEGVGGFAEVCTAGGEIFIESDFYFFDDFGGVNAAYALPGGRNECGNSFGEYNTFWGQHNWICMSNTDPSTVSVIVRAYDQDGNVVAERYITLEANRGIAFDFNAPPYNLPPNTYGVVEVIPLSSPGALITEIVHSTSYTEDGFSTYVSSFKVR